MPSDPRPSLPGRVALAALAAAASACPAGFVDPNPPELQRLERQWAPPAESEPVVYALLLDLHLARGLDCAGTKARLDAQIRSTLITPATPGIELPLVDINPNCRQAPDRHFDPGALDLAIQGAERTYGARHVRAVLLYVNDVDLPVPQSLQTDFASLRILVANRGAPLPVMWTISQPKVQGSGLFQRLMAWKHTEDSGMFAVLAGTAAADLPLEAVQAAPLEGVPVFTPQEAAPVVEWKFCGPLDKRTLPLNFTPDGKAKPIVASDLPRYAFDAPGVDPVMKSAYAFTPVHFWVEICTSHCGHFTRLEDGSVAIWDKTTGCTLPSGDGT